MCKVLLIANPTLREGVSLNDLVGIFPDTHTFSDAETVGFRIVQAVGVTVEQANAFLNNKIPAGLTDEQMHQYKYIFNLSNESGSTLNNKITCKLA